MTVFFREILGIRFALGRRQSISEMLLKVSWMTCVCQAVNMWSIRSQWEKSSSVRANIFFSLDTALTYSGITGLEKQAGAGCRAVVAPAWPCCERQAWKAGDWVHLCWWVLHCCLWTVSNSPPLPPCHCCWHGLLCVWMCQSNSLEAQRAHWSVRLPALRQWEPNWRQWRLCWFLGGLDQRIIGLESSLGHTSLGGFIVHSSRLFNPLGEDILLVSRVLWQVLETIFFFQLIYLFWTIKFHHDRKWLKRGKA